MTEPEYEPKTTFEKIIERVWKFLEAPVVQLREDHILPNQTHSKWYHQKFRRVPTIDECYTDDPMCKFEADEQYRRDRLVDNNIVNILRQRFEDCVLYEAPDHLRKCKSILDAYKEAETNWFIKYGDIGGYHDVVKVFMKEKHRLVWERRKNSTDSAESKDEKETVKTCIDESGVEVMMVEGDDGDDENGEGDEED